MKKDAKKLKKKAKRNIELDIDNLQTRNELKVDNQLQMRQNKKIFLEKNSGENNEYEENSEESESEYENQQNAQEMETLKKIKLFHKTRNKKVDTPPYPMLCLSQPPPGRA